MTSMNPDVDSRLDLDSSEQDSSEQHHGEAVRAIGNPSVMHFGFPWITQIPTSMFITGCLRRGEVKEAVRFLEDSRNMFWSHLRELNGPFNNLPSPFNQTLPPLSTTLRKIGLQYAILRAPWELGARSLNDDEKQKLKSASEWSENVSKLRERPGFERALRPLIMPEALTAASEGPVVVVAGQEEQVHALLFRRDDDDPEILNLLTSSTRSKEIISNLLDMSREILRRDKNSPFNYTTEGEARDTNVILRDLLENLWHHITEPIVQHLGLKKSSSPNRLWWCLVGELEAMPIHASGIYTDRSAPKLSDFAISSYTPSLNALLSARMRSKQLVQNKNMLLVGQSNAPGMTYLPQVVREIRLLKEIIPSKYITTLDGPTSTVEAVITKIPENSLVHFACHGATKRDPLESAIFLHDGQLTLGRLIYTDLKSASIAFLSACQTAAYDPYRSDQVVNLAAGLIAAGMCGVVATLWSMQDDVGPRIARDFYSTMYNPNVEGSNPRQAAFALHRAVTHLKETHESDFTAWVPFIHMGV